MYYIKIGDSPYISSYAFKPEPHTAYALFFSESLYIREALVSAICLTDEAALRYLSRKFCFRHDSGGETLYLDLKKQAEIMPDYIPIVTPAFEGPTVPKPSSLDWSEYHLSLRAALTGAKSPTFAPMPGVPGDSDLETVKISAAENGFVVADVTKQPPLEVIADSAIGAPGAEPLVERCREASSHEDFMRLMRGIARPQGLKGREGMLECAEALHDSLYRAKEAGVADFREILSACVPGPNGFDFADPCFASLYLAGISELFALGHEGGFLRVNGDLRHAVIAMLASIECLAGIALDSSACDYDYGMLLLADALLRFKETVEGVDAGGDTALQKFKEDFEAEFDAERMRFTNMLLLYLQTVPCADRGEGEERLRANCLLGSLLGYNRLCTGSKGGTQ